MKWLSRFFKKCELQSAAIAFAEAGEIEIAREFLQETKREVLFGMCGERINSKTFNCVKNLCERIEAGLDILYVSSSVRINNTINGHIRFILENLDKEHINYNFIFKIGYFEEEILRYVESNKKIVLVVLESLIQGGNDLFSTLKCPLVVVSSTSSDF